MTFSRQQASRRGEVSDLEYEITFLKKHGLLPEQAIERIAELEYEVTMWRKHVPELEATLQRVTGVQRYTVHRDAYTTDNSTGKWIKAEDLHIALTGEAK
jgi:hypothetical protein